MRLLRELSAHPTFRAAEEKSNYMGLGSTSAEFYSRLANSGFYLGHLGESF